MNLIKEVPRARRKARGFPSPSREIWVAAPEKLLHRKMQKLFQPVKEVSPSCKLFGIMEKKRTGGKKKGTVATG